MKTKLLLSLAAIVILSSCSTRFSLQKRRYNHGFYVSVNQKTKPDEIKTPLHEKKKKYQTANEEVVVAPAGRESQGQLIIGENKPVAVYNPVKLNNKHASGNKTKNTITASANNGQSVLNAEFRTAVKPLKALKTNSAAASDANTVLLVILSLFPILCLIAVYLHDGSITMNFWVDLLLHLTVIGAIIFALLVVLDVVNLG